MAKGFTDISVLNLKPGVTRREIPDGGCAGLYAIIQPSGADLGPFATVTTANRKS